MGSREIFLKICSMHVRMSNLLWVVTVQQAILVDGGTKIVPLYISMVNTSINIQYTLMASGTH